MHTGKEPRPSGFAGDVVLCRPRHFLDKQIATGTIEYGIERVGGGRRSYLAQASGWCEGVRAIHSTTVRCVPSFIFLNILI